MNQNFKVISINIHNKMDVLELVLFNTCIEHLNAKQLCHFRLISKESLTVIDRIFKYLNNVTAKKVAIEAKHCNSYALCSPCTKCTLYTNTKYPLLEDQPYMCERCMQSITIAKQHAIKKWKLPALELNKLPSLMHNEKILYDVSSVHNFALQYHKGPCNLAVIRKGMAKCRRYKTVARVMLCVPERDKFFETSHVQKYLNNGYGGVRKLKELANLWKCFIVQCLQLPKSLIPFMEYDWFNEYPNVNIFDRALQSKKEQMRIGKLKLKLLEFHCELCTPEEKQEYIRYGDEDIITRITYRGEKLTSIPGHLQKYVMEVVPEYIFNNCDIKHALRVLTTHAFLIENTSFLFFWKRLQAQNVVNAYDIAKEKVLLTYNHNLQPTRKLATTSGPIYKTGTNANTCTKTGACSN